MSSKPAKLREFRIPLAWLIRGRDLPFFCRSLAAMLNSGLALGDCLRSLESQQRNRYLRSAIVWMRMDVESGTRLSDSMRQFPSLFGFSSTSMIMAAEMTGRMPEALVQIASLLEARYALQRKISSALIYPLVVVGLSIVLVWFLVTHVVPVFASLYQSMGSDLPAPTRVLLASAAFLRQRGLPVMGAALVAALGIQMIYRTPWGRRAFDRVVLAIPLIGSLMQRASLAAFARTYSALIRGGIATPKALEIAAQSVGNRVIADSLCRARALVEAGEPLGTALETSKFIPPVLVQMLRTGEKTGRADDMLDSVADFYEAEVQAAVGGLTAIIMPLLIVIVGLVVGAIAIGALMPLFVAPSLIH